MHRIFIFLLCVLPFAGFGQNLKKIRHYDDTTHDTEIYQVLKSDPSVRQGSYKKINANDFVMVTGFYKNGLKDSLWMEYDYISKHVFSKSYYKDGGVTGICEYYDRNGEVDQKYDYTNDRLIYNKPMGGEPAFDADSVKPGDIQTPAYLGGDWAMMTILMRLVRYPANARRNYIQGRVLIRFFVDADGKATGHYIVKGVDPELDAEALRAVKLLPNHWIPGRQNGEPVRVYYNLPLVFKLE